MERWFHRSAIAISVVGAAILLAAGVRMSGGIAAASRASPFLAWALVPFLMALAGLRGRGVGIPRSAAAILASGFGLAIYAQLLWSSNLGSTAGLAFLFVPVWQILGCAIALVLTRKWRGRREPA